MAVVTILVRSCVFQLVNIILPLNKGRLNVLDLIYRMYLWFVDVSQFCKRHNGQVHDCVFLVEVVLISKAANKYVCFFFFVQGSYLFLSRSYN